MFTIPLPEVKPDRLAVKLSVAGERSVRSGHPWVFSNSILKLNKEGKAGDLAIIFGVKTNDVIGIGLLDPASPIRIKMLHHNGPAKVDSDFFSEKIARAYALRQPLLKTKTNSYRLIFGENDGFPGFIADVYDKVVVVKLYSAIWFPYFEIILKQLIAVINCECVVLRLSRKLQASAAFGLKDGTVIFGTLEDETVRFLEHGVHFSANVIQGHKTGYFLDHRHNRKRVGELSKGKSVLDIFSYAGGFSVHALVKGASTVTSLDISEQALKAAEENAALNNFNGTHKTIVGDAFEVMQKLISSGKTYEVVIVDPPSFAKRQSEIPVALKKYGQLARLGAKLTAKKGVLVLASCSSRISEADFFGINKNTLDHLKRPYKLQQTTAHDIDHPVTFPEGGYLKCGYYKFN